MTARPGRPGFGGRRHAGRDPHPDLDVTGGDGVYVVHAAGPLPGHLSDVAESLRLSTVARGDHVTVLVAAGFQDTAALSDRLQPHLRECRKAGVTAVRLVMSRGGADGPDRPAPARTLCEDWQLDVLAPLGLVVVAPNGALFAPDGVDAPGGWRQFSPGLQPRGLGHRHPAPAWQDAVERVASDTAGGCTVEHVPAGLLIQPVGSPPEGVEALCYAVAVDPAGPTLIVGASRTATVSADALCEIITALPAQVRGTVRLAPGNGTDLLAVAQEVADLLAVEVRVLNGLPLMLEDADREPSARPSMPRVVLTDVVGTPSWRPYVEAVTCVPAQRGKAPAPRLGSWRPPIGGLRPAREPGAMVLDPAWQVAVTRAGLWVGPIGSSTPPEVADRQVAPDLMAIDIGLPGQPLDDTIWDPLDRLFTALQDDVRERSVIQVHGSCSAEDLRGLRRVAVRHDLAVAPRGRPLSSARHPAAATNGQGAVARGPEAEHVASHVAPPAPAVEPPVADPDTTVTAPPPPPTPPLPPSPPLSSRSVPVPSTSVPVPEREWTGHQDAPTVTVRGQPVEFTFTPPASELAATPASGRAPGGDGTRSPVVPVREP